MVLAVLASLCSWFGEFDPPEARVELPPAYVRVLAEQWRFSVQSVAEDGSWIVAGRPQLLNLFDRLGVPYTILEPPPPDPRFGPGKRVPTIYWNPAEFETWVTTLVNGHADIARLIDIGDTVLGRDIWAIKVSDNPDSEEFEPEIRMIGNIHGDEKSSLMVCAGALEWILSNYGSNPQATTLVEQTEMWFVPMTNPDGNQSNSRSNAHGVDLNRNFDGPAGSGQGMPFDQPETQAIKDLSDVYGNHFMLGMTFHSGATCFNSVWNYSGSATLHDLPNFFSSRTGGSPCGNSGGCAIPSADGLAEAYQLGCTYPGFWYVFGADWYVTFGDTNDWSYHFEGTLDTTLECTVPKTPSPDSEIDVYVPEHRQGVINYMLKSLQGIRGLVYDAGTDMPMAAEILVSEIPKPVSTDPVVGDYHRFLVPGTYEITASANGYLPQTVTGVEVLADQSIEVDFDLLPELSFAALLEVWGGPGPYDGNGNGVVDIIDLMDYL